MKTCNGKSLAPKFLALFLFSFSLNLYGLDLSAASISELSGSVSIIAPDGKTRAAVKGAPVMTDEIVETKASSRATLLFDDNSRVQLGPNTRLQVNDPLAEENESVMLFLGRIFARIVPRFSSEPVFTVQTLSTTAGVRGTNFEVAAGMDGTGLVSVEDGVVVLESDNGEVKVGKGEEAEVGSDGKMVKSKRKARTEQEWEQWLGARRQFFLEHSDQVLANLTRKMDSGRDKIKQQDRELKDLKNQLLAESESGRLNFWKARAQIRPQIRTYMNLLKNQSRVDNKMAAFDNLIAQAEQEISTDPAAYSSAFRNQISSARKKLDGMDVRGTISQDRKMIMGHFVVIAKAAKKFGLQNELWRNLPAKTKAKILKRLQTQKSNRSD